jgi:transposase
MTTADERIVAALAAYDSSEPEVARAWRELTTAAVGLGTALARFQTALDVFTAVKPPTDQPHSRACKPRRHSHGPDCHQNCPTCGGR